MLNFEKDIITLEGKVHELRLAAQNDTSLTQEIQGLEKKISLKLAALYKTLTPWQKVQVARHPDRPKAKQFIASMTTQFTPLSGDRLFAEDSAIVGGMGFIGKHAVVILGQERGWDTESRVQHNFGMPKPEGYRKAQRLMRLAEKFSLPVITLVDTPGAYPGLEAEERGQAEAIARSVDVCLDVKTPIISIILGEGGSGGALAIATADHIAMLEHSVYSVISPEGCASILWRDNTKKDLAAKALQCTAQDLITHKLIDAIIPEPSGGAHRHAQAIIASVQAHIEAQIHEMEQLDSLAIHAARREKYLKKTKVF